MKLKKRVNLCGLTFAILFASSNAYSAGVGVEKVKGEFPINTEDRVELEEKVSIDADEKATFELNKGDRLSEVLKRWSDLVGYDLVWEPEPDQGDLKMAGSLTFNATYKKSAEQLFDIIRQQSRFDAQIHPNRVLRVFVSGSN